MSLTSSLKVSAFTVWLESEEAESFLVEAFEYLLEAEESLLEEADESRLDREESLLVQDLVGEDLAEDLVEDALEGVRDGRGVLSFLPLL